MHYITAQNFFKNLEVCNLIFSLKIFNACMHITSRAETWDLPYGPENPPILSGNVAPKLIT